MTICKNCNDKKYNDLLEALAAYAAVNGDSNLSAFLDGYAGPEWLTKKTKAALRQTAVSQEAS